MLYSQIGKLGLSKGVVVMTDYEIEYGPITEESLPDNKPDYVNITLESNVEPLEMRYCQINSCRLRLPAAYRTYTYINSVIEGVIPPEKYAYAVDETERGLAITKWNIAAAAKAVRVFGKAKRHIEFVSVRVSPQIVREVDFYSFLKEILVANKVRHPEKICLEFPRMIFYENIESVRSAILAMKLLKVKSMLSGFGEADCPFTPLLRIPFDYVLISEELTQLIGDRNRTETASTLLSFIRSLKCDFIGEGILDDNQVSVLERADGFGFITSPDYIGEAETGKSRMTLDEAVLQKDGEEI